MQQIIDYFIQPQIAPIGIFVIILIGVIVWQQKRSDKKDDQITNLQNQLQSVSDGYAKSYIDTVREVVATQKDSVNAVNLLQRSFDQLMSAVQSFINGRK